jgi:hypothetical protein
MPIQIVQRAADAGDQEAKSFIDMLSLKKPPPRPGPLFWNR